MPPHSALPYVNGGSSSEVDDVEMVDSDDLYSDGELRYQVMGPDTQHPDVTRVATVAGPVLPEPTARHPIIHVRRHNVYPIPPTRREAILNRTK
ncbi:hypothetical protein Pmani_009959 [Petrolisthes manimaculis]|uniref:Uncharacterized protein n=1 Tax=Petrolisthes manimaculis TaxID=1843537 RepID=A0AAE1Q2E8_9EUCA|nr:hypothetical protein Pmani_009959 [Petrolisthes manimaculis]